MNIKIRLKNVYSYINIHFYGEILFNNSTKELTFYSQNSTDIETILDIKGLCPAFFSNFESYTENGTEKIMFSISENYSFRIIQ